jgi:hypothetical protein
MNSIIRHKAEYYTLLGYDAVFICNYLHTYRVPSCLHVQGNFGTRRQKRSPIRRSIFTHRQCVRSRKNFVTINNAVKLSDHTHKKDSLENRQRPCKFISNMKETYTKLSNLRSLKGKKEINFYFFLSFGATASSGPGPPHPRGF